MTISEQLKLLEDKLQKALVDRGSIISAIRSKGVDIPDNTLLQDIPKYILMICNEEEIIRVINEILYMIKSTYSLEDEKVSYEGEVVYIKNEEKLIL